MKIIHSDNAPAALGPYSQAYEANGFVFTAGELGIDPQTGKLPEGIAAQAEQACKNIEATLEASWQIWQISRSSMKSTESIL